MTNSDTPSPTPEAPDGEPRVAPALVIGHAAYAAGLVSAVGAITGRGELLVPLTNEDAGIDEIERRLADAADATGARVIFTDLPAGSCAFAARRLLRSRPDMVVVTGVTLPALIDYVFHAELPPPDAADHACEMGRKSIAVMRGAGAAGNAASGGTRAG
jgi:PTS system N-acetylgalactosamine-specific IIA component